MQILIFNFRMFLLTFCNDINLKMQSSYFEQKKIVIEYPEEKIIIVQRVVAQEILL